VLVWVVNTKLEILGDFVSVQTSDRNYISCNVSPHSNHQPSKDLLRLSDVSQIGKTWDKHRANADIVSNYYTSADEGCFNRYAWRVKMCSELLEFRLVSQSEESLEFKLSNARFCRVRHCPVCQWRRSLMWKAKAYKILPQVIADYPK